MNEKQVYEKYKGRYFILEKMDESFKQDSKELTKNEYEILVKVTKTLFEYKYFQRKMLEIQLNYQDYFDKVEYYTGWLKEKKFKNLDLEMDRVYVDLNRTFINFVTSFKVFMEHTESRLKKKYGKQSEEANEFKKITHENYDKYFSYRLFYHLRNFSIHYGYPIQNIEFSDDNKEKEYLLIPYFNKAKLLEYDKIKQKLLDDLNLKNHTFPVKHQMFEVQKCLEKLLSQILNIEKNRYDESANLIIDYFENSVTKKDVGFGYAKYDSVNVRVGWQKTMLEIEIAKMIKKKTV